MRRNTPAAIEAFDRGEIDAAFCLPLSRPLPPRLGHALIGIEPMGAVVSPGHALAGSATIAASELNGRTLWIPGTGTDPVVLSYYRTFAAHFGLYCDESGSNLGLHYVLAGLENRLDRILTLPLAIDPRFVPIADPTPYMAWAMIWRPGNRDEDLAILRSALTRVAAADAPPEWDPASCWLPPDYLAYLHEARDEGENADSVRE
jgi:DNA-binding transcriptional LysR family regulator